MTFRPRIIGSAMASPGNHYAQRALSDALCFHVLGGDWETNPEVTAESGLIRRLFRASAVEHRQMAADVLSYYAETRSTGDRMNEYERLSYPLAREALEACLSSVDRQGRDITDFIVVSCTGYSAPGLDIQLARDLGMPASVRRLVIGHMGCFGALVALRSAFALLAAYKRAVVAVLAVELCSLHFNPALDLASLSGFALFGDAAAALVLTGSKDAPGPELVDVYCAADFDSADQMSWRILDEGFIMGLSRRIPVTLRRNVGSVVDNLLAPHGLTPTDITHWLVHPGGPDILEVVGDKLALDDEQLALSWEVLREHGNCSSPTVLLVLDRLLRARRARPGEWGVMMAFGPGLTLESCLLRF